MKEEYSYLLHDHDGEVLAVARRQLERNSSGV